MNVAIGDQKIWRQGPAVDGFLRIISWNHSTSPSVLTQFDDCIQGKMNFSKSENKT